jgi:hypothetical protein
LIQAHQRISELERELASMRNRLRANRAKRIGFIHPSDEQCLRAAVMADYYSRFNSSEREKYPMLEVEFEPEFFAGFSDVCQLVPYGTVLRAVVNICIAHNQTRTESFKAGSRFSEEVDGWQVRRGHIADEANGAPRIRFAKKGRSIRFQSAGHHDDDL